LGHLNDCLLSRFHATLVVEVMQVTVNPIAKARDDLAMSRRELAVTADVPCILEVSYELESIRCGR
jgi:hypothetical protein